MDLVIEGSPCNWQGETDWKRKKGYLNTLYITIEPNRFAKKYDDVEDADYEEEIPF